MPSISLQNWLTVRSRKLDEIEAAHRSVGGSRRGRRHATEQINHAFAVLLSSQFQGFCRDLHSEATNALLTDPGTIPYSAILEPALTLGLKLDHGNPNAGNIGSDFGRFGIQFWNLVQSADVRSVGWQEHLERLNRWRNAIAHQDFHSRTLGVARLHLAHVRVWRRACGRLAHAFDRALRDSLFSLLGRNPW
jgi:hypothetical protein